MEDNQSVVTGRSSFYTARSNVSDVGLPPGRVREEKVKQEIQTIAYSILCEMPLRLLNTQDGKIYTHKALVMKFEESFKYYSLLALITTRSTLDQQQFIAKVVRDFFAYVMLSHRWEDDELAFKEIKAEGVYALPAARFHKVRSFCRQAGTCGFDWAWIDTCCIDQASSAEVQKSISSMFSWYRGSALTIIYLSDVTVSSVEALSRSQWFRRGWTLQELLAAGVIQLYKRDWSLFQQHTAFNHKDVAEILVALESATGIAQRYLKLYAPGVENPRMKLRWAHRRVTKEKEDEAYCLMGIFGFTMSVTYGEGDNAFARLMMEIMRRTRDATLLDWVGRPSSMNTCLPSSPRCFLDDPFGFPGNLGTMSAGPPRNTLSFALAAKLVLVFKRATHRARRNSFHLHNVQEPMGNGSSIIAVTQPIHRPAAGRANGAPQITTTRSSRNMPKRSTSSPIEVPLAELLGNPPWPYSLTPEIHITVPCFVHEVQSLLFEPDSNSYVCHADGIQRFSFVTSERLKISVFGHHSPPSGYLLVRTWDPRLSYDFSNAHHSSMALLRQRLANRFFAMLLEPSDHGQFRRISSDQRIVAQLELPPSQTYGVQFLHLH